MGNYCWDKCVGLMDNVGDGILLMNHTHYKLFSDYDLTCYDVEAGLQEHSLPKPEPAPQAAPQQEPQMIGSSVDVFS